MAFKKNEVKFDLASYPYYLIMGQKKVGKSTLIYELINYLYNGDQECGVTISCGEEDGFRALDGIVAEEALVWDKDPEDEENDDDRGFVQIVDDLVENRNTDYKKVKIACIDTIDELYGIATKQVFKEHKKLKGSYPKSLNDALGGYGAGKDRLTTLVKEQLARLKRAGYAVFLIAHTKSKDKEDILSGQKYEVITNNLTNDLYSALADGAQMIVNIVIEREIKGAGKDKDGKDVAGKVINEKRMMYFRDTGLVEAGGRFKGLPEKLELSPENFMEAFKQGVLNSKREKVDEKQIDKLVEKEQKEIKQKAEKFVEKDSNEDSERKDELVSKIKDVIKEKAKDDKTILDKVNEKNKELGISYKELSNAPFKKLKELALFLKNLTV